MPVPGLADGSSRHLFLTILSVPVEAVMAEHSGVPIRSFVSAGVNMSLGDSEWHKSST